MWRLHHPPVCVFRHFPWLDSAWSGQWLFHRQIIARLWLSNTHCHTPVSTSHFTFHIFVSSFLWGWWHCVVWLSRLAAVQQKAYVTASISTSGSATWVVWTARTNRRSNRTKPSGTPLVWLLWSLLPTRCCDLIGCTVVEGAGSSCTLQWNPTITINLWPSYVCVLNGVLRFAFLNETLNL